MIERRRLLLAGAGTLALPGRLRAQDSGRTTRLVVPYAAGGPTDVLARLFAEQLGPVVGQRVVVENRTGAGVVVGTDIVAKAPPDGQTILLTSVAHAVNPSLFPNLPFDTERDFAPVALVARVPLVLLVPNSLPVRDMAGFLAWLRAQNGRATYGSSGVGGAPHLAAALLLMMTGLSASHVPYRGSAPAMTDLASGRIDFYIDAATGGLAQAKAGTARAIGWSMAERSPLVPDLPTIAEGGVPGYECYTWNTILVPAATPREAVLGLNKAFAQIMAMPALRQRVAELGGDVPEPISSEATGAFIHGEIAKWREVVQKSGMTTQ
ncbi:Bug family tripartite tricarboxylate transporter substrate binding protein [Roseomonas xinghualingensis]|uniref:Bug family tripartite tricarboxylate transporter substrate binding protein n=1 Tax=Roseomonas xinghualingensis TaxID=2986475 RepID=UPI0021F21E2A|nr:tripartite tricarboxylate transporter substrate binding protein [Roseomonas sp. SXEYE001]MCV4210306.1 tripartite tricarboxylate transporter substrate binding protein [Roseomonas sp. SXEYE001]